MVIKMDIAITKMSSKGQIVIPAEIRGDIKEGEKMVLIKNGKQIILIEWIHLIVIIIGVFSRFVK